MDQRSEPRFSADQAVWVTLFGNRETRFPGFIRNVSGRGVGLEVGEPVAAGSAVKIDLPDGFLLGEVIYCRRETGRFYLGVELEHALYGLAGLAEIMKEFPGREIPGPDCAARHRR